MSFGKGLQLSAYYWFLYIGCFVLLRLSLPYACSGQELLDSSLRCTLMHVFLTWKLRRYAGHRSWQCNLIPSEIVLSGTIQTMAYNIGNRIGAEEVEISSLLRGPSQELICNVIDGCLGLLSPRQDIVSVLPSSMTISLASTNLVWP